MVDKMKLVENENGVIGVEPVDAPKHTVLDPKAATKWKSKFDLHVGLIMHSHGLPKSKAVVQAYHEGVEGLTKRLG